MATVTHSPSEGDHKADGPRDPSAMTDDELTEQYGRLTRLHRSEPRRGIALTLASRLTDLWDEAKARGIEDELRD